MKAFRPSNILSPCPFVPLCLERLQIVTTQILRTIPFHASLSPARLKSTFQKKFNPEEPMKSRTGAALMIAAFVCLGALIAAAQTKPNLSGSWKLNREKSKFAGGGPDNLSIKIDHKEPTFVEDWSMSTPNGDRSFQAKYTTDGKETEQEVMGHTARTKAKWDGDALVVEWRSEDRSFIRKITLSADGKTMTKIVTQSKDGGEQTEDTVVFEKQ